MSTDSLPLPFNPDAAEPWTVSQTNARARQLLEGQLGSIQVAGELSGVRRDASGHTWFSLKDPQAALSAVLFRRGTAPAAAHAAPLQDGQAVVVRGRLTVYAASGRYQLVAQSVVQQGAGSLQAAFEALKRRLWAEGLFAEARKRPLPWLPRRVAVVTSPEGAVIRDIIDVATRRHRGADILVVPTRVQGADCAPRVVAALAAAVEALPGGACDVVILARGGGALTDLWGFNDERVARAIVACPVPVVSAIGHQTDVTIADFAADLRAPTPSAAAELVFPRDIDLRAALGDRLSRQLQGGRRRLAHLRLRLRAQAGALGDGRRPLYVQRQRLSDLQARLEGGVARQLRQRRGGLASAVQRLQGLHPRAHLAVSRSRLAAATNLLAQAYRQRLQRASHHLQRLQQRLGDLSPLNTLARGYAIVMTPEGRALRQASDAAVGGSLEVRLARGALAVQVVQISAAAAPR